MSIKTNELQKANAPALTDTILLADSAGGTAQLSLAQAAAFFGDEMVKAGNPVGAALSSKAALSVQQTVEKAVVTNRTVELAAEALQAYIDSLPRLLTENLTIKISGTLTEDLIIAAFYGSGSLIIQADADGDTIIEAQVIVLRCAVPISFSRIHFLDPKPSNGESRNGISVDGSVAVKVYDCEFTSDDRTSDPEHNYRAMCVQFGTLYAMNVIVKNCGVVVLTSRGGISVVSSVPSNFGGNQIGAYVWDGGAVILADRTPDMLGGTSNVKSGGFIVKIDGTLQ